MRGHMTSTVKKTERERRTNIEEKTTFSLEWKWSRVQAIPPECDLRRVLLGVRHATPPRPPVSFETLGVLLFVPHTAHATLVPTGEGVGGGWVGGGL